jgi:5-methylcytosine-specific restriction endonuclease McrA
MLKSKIAHQFNTLYAAFRENAKIFHRSSLWHHIREIHIKSHECCAACGGTKMLQVHHIVPVHIDPSLELDLNNLITLCMGPKECHLNVGHKGSWRDYNSNVKVDSKKLLTENKSNKK